MATFRNQATLSYNGTTVNSNTVTGNIVEALAITKTAVTDSYPADGSVTYIVSLINSGVTPLTGITLTDDLGAYTFNNTTLTPLDYIEGSVTYYQNGILQPDPQVTSSDPLIVTGITVPANGNAVIAYEARANSFAPLNPDGSIVNTVSANGTGITTPVTAEETINAESGVLLGITKALDPVNVTDNTPLTYTFTITNTGNTEATADDNVVITDTFDPVLSDITVTLNGDVLPTTAYTYDEATGVFSTLPGIITVPQTTYTQDPITGEWSATPGTAVLTVTGTV